MIKANFTLIAQKIIIEKNTGLVSLINLVDVFQPVSIPFVAPEFSALVRTERGAEDPQEPELELIMQQGETELFKGKFKVFYKEKTNNLVVTLRGMLIKKNMPIEIICKYNGTNIGTTSMNVQLITQSDKQQ